MEQVFLYSAVALFAYMVVVFVWATLIKDNSIVDIAWGLGFVVVAATGMALRPQHGALQWLMLMAISVWAFRLSGYIYNRHHHVGEDYRYAQWRQEWGRYVVVRAFFQVFMLQGVILYIVALPIMLVMASSVSQAGVFALAGFGLWMVGFLMEAVADYQKSRFKAVSANKGRIMQSGLWRYSRHPNYFGEALLWCGLFAMAIPAGLWYVSLASPVIITFLLTKVSGVAMLEKKYVGNAEWADYARRTSAFVPWWPRG